MSGILCGGNGQKAVTKALDSRKCRLLVRNYDLEKNVIKTVISFFPTKHSTSILILISYHFPVPNPIMSSMISKKLKVMNHCFTEKKL